METVRVKFSHPHGDHGVGDVVELEEAEARRLVRGGVAQVESGQLREPAVSEEEPPAQQTRSPRRETKDSEAAAKE